MRELSHRSRLRAFPALRPAQFAIEQAVEVIRFEPSRLGDEVFLQQWLDVVVPDGAQPRFVEVVDHEITVADPSLGAEVRPQPGVEALEKGHYLVCERGTSRGDVGGQ